MAFGHQLGMQQKMTENRKRVVGRIDKVVAIRGLLDCGVLEPVPLVRGVLRVVGRLLEVPRVVVLPLAGIDSVNPPDYSFSVSVISCCMPG